MVYVPNPPSELSLIEDYSTMEKYIGSCIRNAEYLYWIFLENLSLIITFINL